MKKLSPFVGFVLLLSLLMSCKKEKPDFPYGVPFTFEFRLLDEKGKQATVFEQGKNFSFSLVMTNFSSNKWIFMSNPLTSKLGFLQVYKINSPTDSVDLGQPYDTHVWCTTDELAIQSNTSFEIRRNWISDSTEFTSGACIRGIKKTALPIGQYRTGFTHRFQYWEGDSFRFSAPIRFDIDFKVK